MCVIEDHWPHKVHDNDFLMERKEEFYPYEEYGCYTYLCKQHFKSILNFYGIEEDEES